MTAPSTPIRFFWQPEQDTAASAAQGRPVFRDMPFIEKWTPGDSTTIIRRPVRLEDQDEFAEKFANFLAKKEQKPDGTPLVELGFLTEAQRLEFAAVRVNTVEDIVNMPDSVAQKFMGINGVKARAKAYLEAAAGNAPMLKMQAELESRDAELSSLRDRLAALEKAATSAPAKK